jgi:hypothetical protein
MHTYFRNIHMWAATAPSNLTGHSTSGASYHAAEHIQVTGFVLLSVLAALCI